MLTSVHALVGVAIGRAVGDTSLVIPLSFASHYVLDAIPHYSWKPLHMTKNHMVSIDSLVRGLFDAIEPISGLLLAGYLIISAPGGLAMPMLMGLFFNLLPDLLVYLEWEYGIKRPFPIRQIEMATHRHARNVMGVLTQVVVLVPVLYYLLK